jgi:hypothetical protein
MAERRGGAGSVRLVYHLGTLQIHAARRSRDRGLDVACLNAETEAVSALDGAVRVLGSATLPAFEEAAQVAGSFDLAELAVRELLRRRPRLARALARAAGGEDDLYRYLCRLMMREVGGVFALAQLAAAQGLDRYERVVVDRHWPNGADFAFISAIAHRHGLVLPEPVASALGRLHFEVADTPVRNRLRTAGRAAFSAAGLWAEWLARIRAVGAVLPRRPLLIRTYPTDWGLDRGGRNRLRNVDFVVDGGTIRSEQVGMWVESGVPPERDDQLAARGYAVVRSESVTVGPATFATRVAPQLLTATALFVRFASAEGWWQAPLRNLLAQSLLWGEIARRMQPRALLVVNDLHPTGVARTLALRRAGCRTVIYEYASSWALDEHGWVPDFVYGFTAADALVTWGPLHTRTFEAHRGSIREYWELGCLWSEHARLVRDLPEVGDRYRREIHREHAVSADAFEYVIAVFDTSVAPLLLHADDLVAFYDGVATLAERMPEALLLCKPKFPLERVLGDDPGWPAVGGRLAELANVVLLDSHFETAAAIGLSNMSLNACYTSPAVETIGAGIPALYYDPTQRFPGAFLRRIPRFVAVSTDELERLARHQLQLDDAARAADLRERFGELEGHFDGLAITRLRERLSALL